MRWTKLGQTFVAAQHGLDFAQSPQTLICGDRVRIYFSTRQREASGKFLSQIAFAEFDPKLERLLRVSTKPVLPLGKRGTFDEHGIFPINVVRHDGLVYAFTCGWSRRVSVSVETGIGLAISRDDGLTFERVGDGPVLSASLHEPFLVGDGFVIVRDGIWHMWYIYGTRWIEGAQRERVYKIGYATSPDGRSWTKAGRSLIADRLGPDECQALPTVLDWGGRYHMVFCYRQATDFRKNRNRGYRLGYAWSDDLQSWTRDDEALGLGFSETGWDADMMCYPHLFRCGEQVYLLYNGNEFGRHGFGAARLEP